MAWAITDVEDVQTYQEFFTAVKKRVPNANVTILMTDDGKCDFMLKNCFTLSTFSDSVIVAACSVVYPGVNHLLCRWHIDRYNTYYFYGNVNALT